MSETGDPERKWTEGIDPAVAQPLFTTDDVGLLAAVSYRLSQEYMGDGPHPFEAGLNSLARRILKSLPA